MDADITSFGVIGDVFIRKVLHVYLVLLLISINFRTYFDMFVHRTIIYKNKLRNKFTRTRTPKYYIK